MDYALTIEQILPGAKYSGSLTANTEAAYNAIRWEDDRPKPTLAELAAAQVAVKRPARMVAIDARTSQIITAGYAYADKQFSASANHQTWALGVLVAAQAGTDFTGTIIPTIDNMDSYTIKDNADAIAMASTCVATVKAVLASGSALKAAAATAEDPATITDNR